MSLFPDRVAQALELQQTMRGRQRNLAAEAFSQLLGGATGADGVGPPTGNVFEQNPQMAAQTLATLQGVDPQLARSVASTRLAPSAPLTPGQQAQMEQSAAESAALVQQRQASADLSRQQLADAQELGPLNVQAVQSLIDQRKASAAASRASAQAAAAGQISQTTNTLNQRYLQQIKEPTQVADAVQQVTAAATSGDSLGSLSAIIKLAKVLDPTSVVREGEVTTVQGGLGVAESLMSEYNRWKGEGFSPDGARRIQEVTKAVAAPILQRGQRIQAEWQRTAEMLGVGDSYVTTGAGYPADFVAGYLQGIPEPQGQVDTVL